MGQVRVFGRFSAPHRWLLSATLVLCGMIAAASAAPDPADAPPASPAPAVSTPVKHKIYRRRRRWHHRSAAAALPANAASANQTAPAATSNASTAGVSAKAAPAEVGEAKPDAPALPTQLDSFARDVSVKSAGASDWSPARTRMSLKKADQVRTGERSVARLRMKDGSKVLLLQNSEVQMQELSSVQKTVKLLKGHLRAIVARIQGGNHFQVETPIGVASVRGTDFDVEMSEDGQTMKVEVNDGHVGVAKLGDLANEVVLNPGDKIEFGLQGEMTDPVRSGYLPLDRQDVHTEIQVASVKDNIVSMAAEEERDADYQVGKSLIDAYGQRVRTEEYITRPAADSFKLVVLNQRPTRFDYFTYQGTFNKALPEDLSVALGQLGGRLGTTAPDYYLKDYQTVMSNTVDAVTDGADGGHLVKITYDGATDKFTLTDPNNVSNTRTVDAAALQPDGSYKLYNPVEDTFSLVSADQLAAARKISMRDESTGIYRDVADGDTMWNTRFNTYSSFIDGAAKTAYAKKSTVDNVLAVDLDASFSNAPVVTLSEFPSGSTALYNRLSLYYADGSQTQYDNRVIDNNGTVGDTSDFGGLSTSAAYQNELNNWNFETRVTSSEMDGRCIDLVVDPRIGTMSGLIK